MTFSAPLRGTFIEPIASPGGVVVVPWYLQGGVTAAQCAAAYQPKGAADLAASYINLNSPGTNNAAPGTAPGWDVTSGWIGGSSAYLKTGIIPASGTWSIICRFTGANSNGFAMAELNQANSTSTYSLRPNAASSQYGWGAAATQPGAHTSGIMALAGSQPYYNGATDGAAVAGSWTGPAIEIYLLARNLTGTAGGFFTGNIQAAAIYNIALSSTQVGLIYTAMAAL